MRLLNFFSKKLTKQPIQTEQDTVLVKIDYSKHTEPTVQVQAPDETYKYGLNTKYVCLSTSGDENVCPMCAQFENKIFLSTDAPKLPLCPSCSCAYMYYYKEDLPHNAVISDIKDFVLPAECTPMFYKKQQKIYEERDPNKLIRLCECQLKSLHEFMEPYLSAGFPAPDELACRDLLPDLYMQFGKWKKAENTIKKCIDTKAYYPEDGLDALSDFESYQNVATETLSYITQNPGCLQRNIYKAMGYKGDDKERLKIFLRNSKLITKIKYNNTNQLFCKSEETIDKS